MKTGNLDFKRAVYNLTGINSIQDTFDYKIEKKIINSSVLLPEVIRLEKDNEFHDRSRYFDYWLYLKYGKYWNTSKKTGLALSSVFSVTYGDIPRDVILKKKNHKGRDWETAQHLVIVQLGKDFKTIVVDVFEGLSVNKKDLVQLIIQEHQYFYETKKGAE
jgi:hypothetical protein